MTPVIVPLIDPNSSELGSIRGTMTGFHRSLNDAFRLSGSLILEESPIGDSHSGFFEGDVSGNLDDRIWDGKWGGQFYSHDDVPLYDQNGNVDYVIPGTVAGTMAARSLDDDQHWILSMWRGFTTLFIKGRLECGSRLPCPRSIPSQPH